ncbi:MAG: hypothetical protein QOD06_2462, partial [Candidatus Binatota bacterium]|nr:hypothetical protein [Candidatus Binatota bacterium]
MLLASSQHASPEVSIVVCTRNRARALERCLSAVARQRAGLPFETIVIDNGSTDDTRAVVGDASR